MKCELVKLSIIDEKATSCFRIKVQGSDSMMRTHYVSEITPQMEGKEVTIAGWAHEVRDMGKLKFLVLRDRSGIVQITAKKGNVDEVLLAKMDVVKETVLQVKGKVVIEKQAPGGRELVPVEINLLNKVDGKIPFDVTGKVPADLDVRLDNRHIDLRRMETQAIFKIRSEVQRAFREKATLLGFQEIVPTCIVSAATEGGTNLFPIVYFEREAFLAQSPQLYKQLAVIGGMDKVFMTIPVFRAEKHNTTSHLNEVLQMDIEMGFADHDDAMDALSRIFLHILKCVKQNCADSLEILNQKLEVQNEISRYTYSEIVNKLNAQGEKIEWGEDFTKDQEKKMMDFIKDEAFIIHQWPTKIRAFYSMPNKDRPEICNAYDLMYRGMEIASGAQRIHIPEILVDALRKRDLDPDSFEFYIRAFRMGAPPHAGWSIGAERITMKICNVANIRECTLFPRDRNRLTP